LSGIPILLAILVVLALYPTMEAHRFEIKQSPISIREGDLIKSGGPTNHLDLVSSTITGNVLVERESIVSISESNFVGDCRILIKDQGSVSVTASEAERLAVNMKDNASLHINNLNISDMLQIFITGNASLELYNIYGNGSIYICTNGSATITVGGSIATYMSIHLEGLSSLYVLGMDYGGEMGFYVSSYNNTYVYISQTYPIEVVAGEIKLYDNSILDLVDSSIEDILVYDDAFVNIENSNVSSINIYSGASIQIWDSGITYFENKYPGAPGYISGSVISTINVHSKGIVDFDHCNIGSLSFLKVFNGSLIINASGWYAESGYNNIRDFGSTINESYNDTSNFIRVFNAERFYIDQNIDAVSIIADNVGDFRIQGIVTLSKELVVMNSALLINNTYMNASLFSYFEFHIIDSTVELYSSQISDCYYVNMRGGYLELYQSTMSLVSLKMVYVIDSILILNTSSHIDGDIYVGTIHVADGSFTIQRGAITSFNGTIYSGIVNVSGTVGSGIQVAWIYAENSDLTIMDTIFSPLGIPSLGDITTISTYGSNLTMLSTYYNMSEGHHIDVYMNGGHLYMEDCNISTLGLLGVQGNITNCSIGFSSINESSLMINTTTAEDITVGNNSYIWIYHSNISSLFVDSRSWYPYNTNVTIWYSNMSKVGFYTNLGTLRIYSSRINFVTSVMSDVWINNSICDVVFSAYLITALGDVVIESNTIPSGTYRDLLHLYNTTIYYSLKGVSVINNLPSIKIVNSSYNLLYVNGPDTSVLLNGSSVNVSFIHAENLTMIDSIMDASQFYGASQYFISHSIRMIHSRVIANRSVGMSPSGPPTGNITGQYYIVNSYIWGETIYVGDSVLQAYNSSILGTSNISLIYTYLSIWNTTTTRIYVMNSNISAYTSNMTALYLRDTNVTIVSCNIQEMIAIFDVEERHEDSHVELLVYGRKNSGYIENTTIQYAYTRYYIIDHWNVSFNNETVYGPYGEKMKYVNTAPASFKLIVFEIVDYGHVKIENYNGKNMMIHGIWVDTIRDESPPSVTALNDTYIEYEYGEEHYVCFELHDETPTTYHVYLNGTEILSNTYYDGYILRMRLSDFITRNGTYNLTVLAYDSEMNVDVETVEVVVYPSEPPTITSSPHDTYTVEVGEYVNLTWVATDRSPDTYTIYMNGTIMVNGSWISGEVINYIFNATSPGTYNITIVFSDRVGNRANRTVIIRVKEITTETTETTETTTPRGFLGGATVTTIAIAGVATAVIIVVVILLARKK